MLMICEVIRGETMDYEGLVASIGSLPLELIEHILLYIPYHTIMVLCKCDRGIDDACHSSFWKEKYIHDFSSFLDPIAETDVEKYKALYEYVVSPSFLAISCMKVNVHRDLLHIPKQRYINNELGEILERRRRLNTPGAYPAYLSTYFLGIIPHPELQGHTGDINYLRGWIDKKYTYIKEQLAHMMFCPYPTLVVWSEEKKKRYTIVSSGRYIMFSEVFPLLDDHGPSSTLVASSISNNIPVVKIYR